MSDVVEQKPDDIIKMDLVMAMRACRNEIANLEHSIVWKKPVLTPLRYFHNHFFELVMMIESHKIFRKSKSESNTKGILNAKKWLRQQLPDEKDLISYAREGVDNFEALREIIYREGIMAWAEE